MRGRTVIVAGAAADVEELVAEIGSAGGHAVAVPTDFSNPVAVWRLVEQARGAFGRLDAVVWLCSGPLDG